MLVDTHAHLDAPRFAEDRDEVVSRAHQAGVDAIITCGADLASSRQALDLCNTYPGMWATVGVHPHEAQSVCAEQDGQWLIDDDLDRTLRKLADNPQVVAIGEIGLDYHYDFAPREAQGAVFAAQVALAVALDLPAVIHCREADDDLIELLERAPALPRGVLHCFLGSPRLAEWALAHGFYLGVAGPITFARMEWLAEILAAAPAERLLVETDCPYLAPHPRRGQRNEPAFVTYVAAKLAEVRGLSIEALAELTARNARELFNAG